LTGSADLLKSINIELEPLGVTKQSGFCDRRAITVDEDGRPIYGPNAKSDTAYRMTDKALLTVPTSQVFPGIDQYYYQNFLVFESNG